MPDGQQLTIPALHFPTYYAWGVYNLAGHFLVMYAQDTPPSTYFSDLREKMGLNSFQAGIVQSASDQGTSSSLMIPDFYKTMTMADYQMLKTPWGRAYLALAQAYGPTIWGMT